MYTGSKITLSYKVKTNLLVILLVVSGMLLGAIPLVMHVPSMNGASLMGVALLFSAYFVADYRNTSREHKEQADV